MFLQVRLDPSFGHLLRSNKLYLCEQTTEKPSGLSNLGRYLVLKNVQVFVVSYDYYMEGYIFCV